MKEHDLVSVYVGSTLNAQYLEAIFSETNIACLLRNSMDESLHAGFGGGFQESSCEIFVELQDYEAAEKIIYDFEKQTLETDE